MKKLELIIQKYFTFIGIQYGVKSDLHLYNCNFCNSTRVLKKELKNV